ncbi:hypothetical protein AB0J72_52100 [Dactylosporangium sp. NPDC049742]|uniref:hypothetical protein n=1 Tax=Dactylosporangium sp. NPDC049742 TaxID=3154737 RepID=UPI003431714F
MELSPQQRDQLAQLLRAELGTLRDDAVASGADAEAVAGTLESRRRALEADAPDGAPRDDAQGDPQP